MIYTYICNVLHSPIAKHLSNRAFSFVMQCNGLPRERVVKLWFANFQSILGSVVKLDMRNLQIQEPVDGFMVATFTDAQKLVYVVTLERHQLASPDAASFYIPRGKYAMNLVDFPYVYKAFRLVASDNNMPPPDGMKPIPEAWVERMQAAEPIAQQLNNTKLGEYFTKDQVEEGEEDILSESALSFMVSGERGAVEQLLTKLRARNVDGAPLDEVLDSYFEGELGEAVGTERVSLSREEMDEAVKPDVPERAQPVDHSNVENKTVSAPTYGEGFEHRETRG